MRFADDRRHDSHYREGMLANLNPSSFLLNQSETTAEDQVVDAPAFSLTKVLAAAAVIVTPIATILVDRSSSTEITLSAGNYVALAAAVLGFLAIASAADVFARAIATSAEANVKAGIANAAHMVTFRQPLPAAVIADGADPDVQILAMANTDEPIFLIKRDDVVEWLPSSSINLRR
jgi:hypothetical protein